MSGSGEDRRAAVSISVNLSGQLMAAALAVLAILGAYVGYALVEREVGPFFAPSAAVAAVSLAVSVFVAGKAVTKDRNAGFEGDWKISEAKALYNMQAAMLLLGLVSFAVTLGASGSSTDDEVRRGLAEATERIGALESQVITLHARQSAWGDSLSTVLRRLERMESPER